MEQIPPGPEVLQPNPTRNAAEQLGNQLSCFGAHFSGNAVIACDDRDTGLSYTTAQHYVTATLHTPAKTALTFTLQDARALFGIWTAQRTGCCLCPSQIRGRG